MTRPCRPHAFLESGGMPTPLLRRHAVLPETRSRRFACLCRDGTGMPPAPLDVDTPARRVRCLCLWPRRLQTSMLEPPAGPIPTGKGGSIRPQGRAGSMNSPTWPGTSGPWRWTRRSTARRRPGLRRRGSDGRRRTSSSRSSCTSGSRTSAAGRLDAGRGGRVPPRRRTGPRGRPPGGGPRAVPVVVQGRRRGLRAPRRGPARLRRTAPGGRGPPRLVDRANGPSNT